MKKIETLLDNHNKYFENILSFVPSENSWFIFDSIWKKNIDNRYYFINDNLKSSFLWKKYITEIYNYIEFNLKQLLKSDFINLSPISGLTQMLLILKSFWLEQWDFIMWVPLNKWGHYNTKRLIELLWYKFIEIPFEWNNINHIKLVNLINSNNIKLLYVDQMTWVSNFNFDFSIKQLINHEIIFYNDISHNLAFIISWVHKNPIDLWFDAFGWSFHKSFPGPQKAFVATNNIILANSINNTSDILFSSIHFWDIYDVWIVLDYMDWKWETYTKNIILNVNIFWKILEEYWFEIIWKKWNIYSFNHQLLFLLPNSFSPDNFAKKLEEIWILVNSMFLPFTNWKKGIRMWFQEVTLLGMGEENIIKIASLFNLILIDNYNVEESIILVSDIKKDIIKNKI